MTTRVWCLLSLSLSLSSTGCDPKQFEDEDTGAVCPEDSKVTYEGFVAPFMTSYCTRCHGSDVKGEDRLGAPLDHNFDNIQVILDEAVHIAETAAGGPAAINTSMPPSGNKPSDAERKKLGEWIACQIESGAASDHGHDHDHGSEEASHEAGQDHAHDAGQDHAHDAAADHVHDAGL